MMRFRVNRASRFIPIRAPTMNEMMVTRAVMNILNRISDRVSRLGRLVLFMCSLYAHGTPVEKQMTFCYELGSSLVQFGPVVYRCLSPVADTRNHGVGVGASLRAGVSFRSRLLGVSKSAGIRWANSNQAMPNDRALSSRALRIHLIPDA